jgi:hypothetical protein
MDLANVCFAFLAGAMFVISVNELSKDKEPDIASVVATIIFALLALKI